MFPLSYIPTTESQTLTKREAFAMAAMQGLLAKHGDNMVPIDAAQWALIYADCLGKALKETP